MVMGIGVGDRHGDRGRGDSYGCGVTVMGIGVRGDSHGVRCGVTVMGVG